MFEKIICFIARIDCNKINPIKYDRLLRFPAQSLDEEIQDILYSFVVYLVVCVTIMTMLTIMIDPWFAILNLITSFILFTWLVKKIYPKKLGRDGEKAMAQYLNIIARNMENIYIFHDIINHKDSYNIDHIVVSKKGIFIIDTKTYSKQKGIQKNTIKSDGKYLYKNGARITRKNLPLQIKGQAKWLEDELRKKLGVNYKVIRTIAFIGWYVTGRKIDNTYITNAKNIHSILENQLLKDKFDDAELKRITSVLHGMASQSNIRKQLCCS